MATEVEVKVEVGTVTIIAPLGVSRVYLQDFNFPPHIVARERFVPGQVFCRLGGTFFVERKIVAARAGRVVAIHVEHATDIKEGEPLISVVFEGSPAQDVVVAGTVSWETASRMRPREKVECPEEGGSETEITAPIEGIFYCADSPISQPLVEVRDIIERGQTVCVLESMKVFNRILYCGRRSARVISIEAENEQLVKPGQILIRLKPVEVKTDNDNSTES